MAPIDPENPPLARESTTWRSIGLLGAGALLALGISVTRDIVAPPGLDGRPQAGTVVFWAADRDGGAVYGLDRDLILARRIPLVRPIAIAARREGGAWVLRSVDGRPRSATLLARIGPDGSVIDREVFGRGIDLVATGEGEVLVLEEAEEEFRVFRCGRDRGRELSHRAEDIVAIAESGGRVAVGSSEGRIVRFDLASGDRAPTSVPLGGRILEIAPGPCPGSFWVLSGPSPSRLHRLDEDPARSWSTVIGDGEHRLAPVEGEECVWIGGPGSRRIHRFGRTGRLEIAMPDPPMLGLDRVVASPWGEVLLASPGGILRLDASGRRRPGQGGFAYLIDLDAVPGARP